MRLLRWIPVVTLALVVQGCGGSSGGGTPRPPTTPPGTGTSQNPCSSTSSSFARSGESAARATEKRRAVDGSSRFRVIDSLSLHREAAQWRERLGSITSPDAAPKNNVDIGEIAVLQDEGDLVAPANAYDLRGLGLRFTSNGSGGYQVTRIPLAFRTSLGRQLTLEDDDSEPANVAFPFNFF